MDINFEDLVASDKQVAKLSQDLIKRVSMDVLSEFIGRIALADSDEDTIIAKRIYNGAEKALSRLSEVFHEISVRDEPDDDYVHID